MDKLSFTALNAKAESDRIALSWEVDTDLPADSVSFEAVRFNEDDGLVVEEAQEARAHTFTGLKQDTEYVLFVHAYAEPGHTFICEHPDDGVGLAVKTKAQSEEDVKPVIPPVEEEPKPVPTSKALQVSDLTSNGFKITWEKEEGKSTRYHAFLKEATEPDSAWRSLINKKNIGSTTAKNLKADTPYVFYVDVFDESDNLVRHDTGEVRTKAIAKKDPWASISKKYPVGSTHKATIRGFTNYAVMTELEEGVLGQIHISELSWDRVDNPTDFGAVGDVVDVLILDIYETPRKIINLSHKRLTPKPTASSLLFCLFGATDKNGDRYAALPDVVKPYDNGGSLTVIRDEFGTYLFKTDGKTKEGVFIDSKYIRCTVSDSSVLSVRYGSMYVSVGNGPTANASAIVFKMLKNGTSSVKIKVLDPNKSGAVLYDKTFTVEVKNPAWEKSSTLKATTVTGYYLGFNWEKMDDKSVRYSAYLKESREKEWRQIMDRCTDTCGIGSGGLKADTQYDFYYEIVDVKGNVLRHEECSVRTSDKVLKVSNVTSNSFTIEWEPLDKAKHPETNYGVYLAGEGPGTAWCRQYKGISSFNYTGLKPGISYTPLVYVYGPDGKEVFTYEAENDVLTPPAGIS